MQTDAFTLLRRQFPILSGKNRGKPLIYLDSASSSQRPLCVLDEMQRFYREDYANVHRGIYELSERATDLYEAARATVQRFLHAASVRQIVFTSGTTMGLNFLAHSLHAYFNWQAGDEIILTEMEHHANIVPWYFLKERYGLELKIIPVLDDGSLDLNVFQKLLNVKTKLVAVSHISNVLGVINPIKSMAAQAHAHDALLVVDGAQAAPHIPVDVQALDCDFYVFSGHKCYGPNAVGVVYGKQQWLSLLPPFLGGGSMIEHVSFDQIKYAEAPWRFEAGTPPIGEVVGLATALNWLMALDMQKVAEHEQRLLHYALTRLKEQKDVVVYGTAAEKIGVISFNVKFVHAHDVGTILDSEGIAIRAGHHCAMPLMKRFGTAAMARASFAVHTGEEEIDAWLMGLNLVKKVFT